MQCSELSLLLRIIVCPWRDWQFFGFGQWKICTEKLAHKFSYDSELCILWCFRYRQWLGNQPKSTRAKMDCFLQAHIIELWQGSVIRYIDMLGFLFKAKWIVPCSPGIFSLARFHDQIYWHIRVLLQNNSEHYWNHYSVHENSITKRASITDTVCPHLCLKHGVVLPL